MTFFRINSSKNGIDSHYLSYSSSNTGVESDNMVNSDFANNEPSILLSVRGASQATGGMLTERRIWQLVKSKQIPSVNDNGKVVIPFAEFLQFLNDQNGALAA